MRTKTVETVEVFADLKMNVSVNVPADKVEEVAGKIEMAVQQVLLTMITVNGEVLMPNVHDHSVTNIEVLED